MMGKRVFLAAALMVLAGTASAKHGISPEPEPEASMGSQTGVQPLAPKVDVTFPSALDVYVVPAATREVCTTLTLGYDEVRTECRMEPLPVRGEDPALRGVCVTRYGHRTCY